ncbi:MAG: 30S ribosomal protein S6 [candidate division Zixibacteria bacterium]|nr:30S ribosomal protein S6 [candidate division Zixibacteria bacterium]
MNKYETTIVLDVGLDQSAVENEISNVERIIAGKGGNVIEVEKWGVKRFAYELKKRHQGNYIHIKFESDGSVPKDLASQFNFNENIIRYLTVVSEEAEGLKGALERQRTEEEGSVSRDETRDDYRRKPSVAYSEQSSSGDEDSTPDDEDERPQPEAELKSEGEEKTEDDK